MNSTKHSVRARRAVWLAAAAVMLGSAGTGAVLSLLPASASAQAAAPNLAGVWAGQSRYIDEGIGAGIPIELASVGWAPLSAGPPERRMPPSFEEQKKQMEQVVRDDIDLFAHMARNAFRPPLTEAGQKAMAERTAAQQGQPRNPMAQCMPRNMIGPGGGEMTLMQSADKIVMTFPDGTWRTVYLRGGKPADAAPSYTGYSVGRWVNGALVVETTNFLGETANGWPMGEKAKVTETYTLVNGGKGLNIKTIYEDPENLREPVARMTRLVRKPDNTQIITTSCIENVVGAQEYQQTIEASGNKQEKGTNQ